MSLNSNKNIINNKPASHVFFSLSDKKWYHPIFFDMQKKRWKKMQFLFFAVFDLMSFLIIFSITSIFIYPLNTNQNNQNYKNDKNTSYSILGDSLATQDQSNNNADEVDNVNKNKIALTFDDGPDPKYTEQVLDVLKKNNVKATFFVVGLNANYYPGILKRISSEGHDIGHHTYFHSNVSVVPKEQIQLEINATQRIFESYLGYRSYLFRPPYDIDSVNNNALKGNPTRFLTKQGFKIVSEDMDSLDWKNIPAQKIVDGLMDSDDKEYGNIILLHDGGGDRTQTIKALPELIKKFKDRGKQFVTISQLYGIEHNQMMPKVNNSFISIPTLNAFTFSIFRFSMALIEYLFIITIVLGIARLLFIGVLAYIDAFKKKKESDNISFLPTVSIIVPAYNEEKVIVKTINNLLQSDYPYFDIIVVDDGSKDNTYKIAQEKYIDNPKVKVFTKPNGGKAQASNFGISNTNAEIIITVDADTVFLKDAVRHLVKHFADKTVGAVAGNAKVGNRLNILTHWQALEYITGQNLDRRCFNLLNCISVVPGAIGAWRKDIVIKAGGFGTDTLAEDTDLTLFILKMGYKVTYEEKAIALTEAPDTVSGLIKQRFRWTFGVLQAIWKHKEVFLRKKYKNLGFVAIPNLILFQILLPLFSPIMDVLMIITVISMGLQRFQHPETYSFEGLQKIILFYLFFLFLDVLTAVLAFLLEKNENWKLILLLPFQRFYYRQLLYFTVFKSVIEALKGYPVGWGKLERKATVAEVPV